MFEDATFRYPYLHSYLLCESERTHRIFDEFITDMYDTIFEYKEKAEINPELKQWLDYNPVFTGWCFDSQNQIVLKTGDEKKFHPIYFVYHVVIIDGHLHYDPRHMALRERDYDVSPDEFEHDSIIIDIFTVHFLRKERREILNAFDHELEHVLDFWTPDGKSSYDSNDISYNRISPDFYKDKGVFLDKLAISKNIRRTMYIFSQAEQNAILNTIPDYIRSHDEDILWHFSVNSDKYDIHTEKDLITEFASYYDDDCHLNLRSVRIIIYNLRKKIAEQDYLFPVLMMTTLVEFGFLKNRFNLYGDYSLAKNIQAGTFKMDNYIMSSLTYMIDEIEEKFNDYIKRVYETITDTFRELKIWKRYPVYERRQPRYLQMYNQWFPKMSNIEYTHILRELYKSGDITEDEMFHYILFNYADNLLNVVNMRKHVLNESGVLVTYRK